MPTEDHTTSIEFREIPRFPGYRFGSDGSIWSRWNRTGLGLGKGTKSVLTDEWKRLQPRRLSDGYRRANLKVGGAVENRGFAVHRLILEAFCGPPPRGMQCCHNDGDRENNRIENLRWDTPKANKADAFLHGTVPLGEAHSSSKLTRDDVLLMRRMGFVAKFPFGPPF